MPLIDFINNPITSTLNSGNEDIAKRIRELNTEIATIEAKGRELTEPERELLSEMKLERDGLIAQQGNIGDLSNTVSTATAGLTQGGSIAGQVLTTQGQTAGQVGAGGALQGASLGFQFGGPLGALLGGFGGFAIGSQIGQGRQASNSNVETTAIKNATFNRVLEDGGAPVGEEGEIYVPIQAEKYKGQKEVITDGTEINHTHAEVEHGKMKRSEVTDVVVAPGTYILSARKKLNKKDANYVYSYGVDDYNESGKNYKIKELTLNSEYGIEAGDTFAAAADKVAKKTKLVDEKDEKWNFLARDTNADNKETRKDALATLISMNESKIRKEPMPTQQLRAVDTFRDGGLVLPNIKPQKTMDGGNVQLPQLQQLANGQSGPIFPKNPKEGDTFRSHGVSWIFSAGQWRDSLEVAMATGLPFEDGSDPRGLPYGGVDKIITDGDTNLLDQITQKKTPVKYRGFNNFEVGASIDPKSLESFVRKNAKQRTRRDSIDDRAKLQKTDFGEWKVSEVQFGEGGNGIGNIRFEDPKSGQYFMVDIGSLEPGEFPSNPNELLDDSKWVLTAPKFHSNTGDLRISALRRDNRNAQPNTLPEAVPGSNETQKQQTRSVDVRNDGKQISFDDGDGQRFWFDLNFYGSDFKQKGVISEEFTNAKEIIGREIIPLMPVSENVLDLTDKDLFDKLPNKNPFKKLREKGPLYRKLYGDYQQFLSDRKYSSKKSREDPETRSSILGSMMRDLLGVWNTEFNENKSGSQSNSLPASNPLLSQPSSISGGQTSSFPTSQRGVAPPTNTDQVTERPQARGRIVLSPEEAAALEATFAPVAKKATTPSPSNTTQKEVVSGNRRGGIGVRVKSSTGESIDMGTFLPNEEVKIGGRFYTFNSENSTFSQVDGRKQLTPQQVFRAGLKIIRTPKKFMVGGWVMPQIFMDGGPVFPFGPKEGDTHLSEGVVYVYTNGKWTEGQPGGGIQDGITANINGGLYRRIQGQWMEIEPPLDPIDASNDFTDIGELLSETDFSLDLKRALGLSPGLGGREMQLADTSNLNGSGLVTTPAVAATFPALSQAASPVAPIGPNDFTLPGFEDRANGRGLNSEEQVRLFQKGLIDQGFKVSRTGEPDGIYGPLTDAAANSAPPVNNGVAQGAVAGALPTLESVATGKPRIEPLEAIQLQGLPTSISSNSSDLRSADNPPDPNGIIPTQLTESQKLINSFNADADAAVANAAQTNREAEIRDRGLLGLANTTGVLQAATQLASIGLQDRTDEAPLIIPGRRPTLSPQEISTLASSSNANAADQIKQIGGGQNSDVATVAQSRQTGRAVDLIRNEFNGNAAVTNNQIEAGNAQERVAVQNQNAQITAAVDNKNAGQVNRAINDSADVLTNLFGQRVRNTSNFLDRQTQRDNNLDEITAQYAGVKKQLLLGGMSFEASNNFILEQLKQQGLSNEQAAKVIEGLVKGKTVTQPV